MLYNSFPYLILLLSFLILGILEKCYPHERRKVQILECFLFIFFFFFRGFVGTDWTNYYEYYTSLSNSNYTWNLTRYEPSFSILANLCHALNFDYNGWIFLLVAIQGILFDSFFSKKVDYMFLPYIITIAIFPNLIIDTLRNFLSILVGLSAIEENRKKHILKSVVLLLLSISFHLSGILFIILFPLSKFYFNKKVIYALFIVGLIVFFFRISFIEPVIKIIGRILGGEYEIMANLYVEGDSAAYDVSIGIIEKILIFFLVMYKYDSIVKTGVIDKYLFNIFILYILCQFYLTEMSILVTRFAVLFFAGYVAILSSIDSIYRLKSNKTMLYVILLSLCLFKTSIAYNADLYKYHNIIFQEESLNDRKYNVRKHYS